MKPDPDLTSAFRVGVQWAWKEKGWQPSLGRGYLPPGRPEPILNAPTCWNRGANADRGESGEGERRRKERRAERPEREASKQNGHKRCSWESAVPFSTLTVAVSKGSACPAQIWMMFSSGHIHKLQLKPCVHACMPGRENTHTHTHAQTHSAPAFSSSSFII